MKDCNVYVTDKNGQRHHFGCFVSRDFANYNIALAKSTSGIPGYIDYAGCTFEIVEEGE